ncbi:plasmodesmata-located protein 6-like [Henckelia pumila]|uniref:plasmodesmata-located protein 6-like n=1 Tax=Henckelia pumila TaxID=405737 RepID=UPI003C6E3B59
MHAKHFSFPNFSSNMISSATLTFLIFLLLISANTSDSSPESFVYLGCSQLKYNPNSPYQSNVNSILASLVNSASFANYNSFKNAFPASVPDQAVLYGLFQCRGDLTNPGDCHDCVADAVSRLGALCVGASGGALQFDGCYVRYDNVSFLGAEDKTVVYRKCGPSTGYGSDLSTRIDGVLGYLAGSGQYFRVGGSGNLKGYAQCTQDLSMSECQDCLSEAIQRLRSECGSAAWGDMFLGKCYARYSERGYTPDNGNDDEIEKTLAIIIGLIAGVSLLIFFLSCLSKFFDTKGGK